MSQLMTTREVADYLRIKERKIYDLVRTKRIPCTRVTGKWLFPKHLIDVWLARGTEFPELAKAALIPAPPVVVGSHDPLLEWSLRESGLQLAMRSGGSLDGLDRLTGGEAMICGLHVLDAETGEYNKPAVRQACAGLDAVLIEWAWREQGLVLAPGNPKKIASVADLKTRKARVVDRQREAGSHILLQFLLAKEGMRLEDLDILPQPARSETDLGLAVLEGKADAGVAVATVARQYRLDFVPLYRERYDLLMRRRDYFEPPVQSLFAFTRSDAFQARARDLAGYDVSGLGRVVYNAP